MRSHLMKVLFPYIFINVRLQDSNDAPFKTLVNSYLRKDLIFPLHWIQEEKGGGNVEIVGVFILLENEIMENEVD